MSKKTSLYIYPELSTIDLGWLRLSGAGLANCLFVAARAFLLGKQLNASVLSPTWAKFSIGPYLRRESDKRHYIGLFKPCGITGWQKLFLIIASKFSSNRVIKVSGLGNYFTDLHADAESVRDYISSLISHKILNTVIQSNLKDSVAIHIRLGDYTSKNRIPLSWYASIINEIHQIAPERKIHIFSDGKPEELADILSLPNTSLAFFGNALADIMAISQCALVVASDSTFSAWGAFLGNKPIVFSRRHFPPVFPTNSTPEIVLGENTQLPHSIQSVLLGRA